MPISIDVWHDAVSAFSEVREVTAVVPAPLGQMAGWLRGQEPGLGPVGLA